MELTIGMQLLSSVAITKLVCEPAGENTSGMHAFNVASLHWTLDKPPDGLFKWEPGSSRNDKKQLPFP